MAEGKRSGCKIIPRKDTSLFSLRVWLSSREDPLRADRLVGATDIVVAGYKFTAYYVFQNTKITLALGLRGEPVLGGPAKVSTRMVLLDKTGSPVPSMGTENHKDGCCSLLAAWGDVRANCLTDNYFVVLCSVDIDRTPSALSLEEELPDLGHDLALMSDKQEFTDVSFDVGGESFSAHRLVLAARSPVFKAELYGLMAESKMTSITIKDMESSTFRSMLHYMYHGSLPSADRKDVSCTMAQYQHLIVAADRYSLEGLKKICEDKLCGNGITVDNVVSMLELAECHVCPKLKARCLDFLLDGESFKTVATTDAYFYLMQSVPSLFVDVRNRFKMAHEKPTITELCAQKKTRMS